MKKAAKTPPKSDSIETAVGAYIDHIKPRNRSWPETLRIFTVDVLPVWRGRRIGDIAKADVKSLLASIVGRPSPIMANRVLAAIRRFFSWAVEEDLVEVSPCASIKAPSAEVARERVLSDRELAQVLAAADACGYPAAPLVRLLALTGLRRAEVP
jgi:integrase